MYAGYHMSPDLKGSKRFSEPSSFSTLKNMKKLIKTVKNV